MKKKILFVCLGNICRSPSAEAVMKEYISINQLENAIFCDSAGTSGWHIGDRADRRMRKHAAIRNYKLESIARQFNPEKDFDAFDYIVAMDEQNEIDLNALARNTDDLKKIKRMTNYCTQYSNHHSVPDPYYGGDEGFEQVLDILEDACEGLLKKLK